MKILWHKRGKSFYHTTHAARLYYLRKSGFYAAYYATRYGTWQRLETPYFKRFTLEGGKVQLRRLIARGEVMTNDKEEWLNG